MYIHDLNPFIFNEWGLKIRFYGLFLACCFLLSYFLAKWYLKLYEKSEKYLDLMFMACFLGVVIGARLGYVFFYGWPYFQNHLINIFYIWQGGLASHGAIIGLALAVLWLAKKTGYRVFFVSDLVCLASTLGVIFVRLGNFINGEVVGRVTSVPWAVVFPCNSYIGENCGSLGRHPSQLYEALLGLGLFIFFFFLIRKFKNNLPTGLITGLFLLLYLGGRFYLEFYKEYTGTVLLSPLTNGQLLSIPFIILGIGILIKVLKRR